jgi:hypothetical protein
MTSSARANIEGGTVRPRACARSEVDDQLELGRLLNRRIGGFGAAQHFDERPYLLPEHFGEARAVGGEATLLCRGGSMYTRKARATREAPMRDQG